MTKPVLKLEAVLLSGFLVLVGFGLGYTMAGLRSQPVDESSLVFASFDTDAGKNEKIYGHEVLEKIGPELEQLERAKYDLKRRATEGMIRSRLASATTSAGVKAADTSANEVTPAELAAFLKERRIDRDRLSAHQLQDITANLRLQKAASARNLEEDSRLLKAGVRWKIPPPATRMIDLAGGLVSPLNKGAPIKIVLVSNLNCPTCRAANQRVEVLKATYKAKLEIAYRFVLSEPDGSIARLAAEAALCANDQKKFWEFNDAVLAAQVASPADLLNVAKTLNIDLPKFEACTTKREFKDALEKESEKSKQAGAAEAPMILIDDHAFNGASSGEYFSQVIDSKL